MNQNINIVSNFVYVFGSESKIRKVRMIPILYKSLEIKHKALAKHLINVVPFENSSEVELFFSVVERFRFIETAAKRAMKRK